MSRTVGILAIIGILVSFAVVIYAVEGAPAITASLTP